MSGDARREANADRLLQTLPGAELFTAVNGRAAVEAGTVRTRAGDAVRPRYPFALQPGEIGCFLSHRACWQRIVEERIDWALIVEDDLGVEPGLWAQALELLRAQMTPDHFIRLPAKAREKPVHSLAQNGAAHLFLPRVIGLQTVCQAVGRGAAQRLLRASETLDRPVDTFLQMHWATGQPVHTILPNGVRELTAELGGSTIQKKTRASGKLAREWNRLRYRTQVALRPQRG